MSQDNTPANASAEETFYTKLGVSLASLKNARKAIEANRTSGNVVCLVGAAGIGKTHLVRQVAADRAPIEAFEWHGQRWEKSVPVKALYLAHMQAEDMGVPYPSRAKRNELLRECDLFMRIADMAQNGLGDQARAHALELAEHVLKSGSALEDGTFEFLIEKNLKDLPPEGVLFLDEWNRADKSVIKAFFTLLEDREVHGCQLVPPGIQIVAAMNPSDGAHSVNEAEKDHAFRRRLSLVAVTANVGAWLEYAEDKFHPDIVEFIKAAPALLYDTQLRDAGKAFPCPATWEKVSTILQDADRNERSTLDDGVMLSVEGYVGQAVAAQFFAYIRDAEILINPDEVLNKYTAKSEVRRRVCRLVKLARNDVINALCTSVAITLFRRQVEPLTVTPHLALFMRDLQPEMAVALIAHKMNAAMKGIDGADDYLTQLSEAIIEQPAYQELFEIIGSATRNARKEVGEKTENALDT